jgi:uncharacterized protein YfaS (alpha-2-macroglobulin family)
MLRTRRLAFSVVLFLSAATGVWILAADPPPPEKRREEAAKLFTQGNFKEAYDALRLLALDPKNNPAKVGDDLTMAVGALERLGRTDEVDEFREAVAGAWPQSWRVQAAVAKSYVNVQHQGFIIAGKYHRGGHRGGGKFVDSWRRDRVRALQLLEKAGELSAGENDKNALSDYYMLFAQTVARGEAWRLQSLTKLDQLPDYDEGYYGRGGSIGAPVDDKGEPVFHYLPKTFKLASSDGQRWRWLLERVVEQVPGRASEVDMIFAGFLQQQFGEQTLAYRGFRFGAGESDSKTGTFALHTLGEDETIANLATGIKRFKLPDEFNYIKVFQRVADRAKTQEGQNALEALASVFENRRQYPKAAEVWKRAIQEYGPGSNNHRQQRLDQIVGNWGRFEPTRDFAAGPGPVVDFRFRNGDRVAFEAYAIRFPKLLEDVKAHLTNHQGQVDWQRTNIENLGYRLIEKNEAQYIGEKIAGWELELKPRPNHVDDRVSVSTPLQTAGAYLLVAKMANGNTSRIVVWVNDLAIIKKNLENKVMYFVADAITGRPVPDMQVDFFGWKVEQVAPNQNQWRTLTQKFTQKTDKDGMVVVGPNEMSRFYNWLTVARGGQGDSMKKFAHLGFQGIWYNNQHDPEYNATRTIVITDRPVYRPNQNVQFKAWVRHAKYDEADISTFANQQFTVEIFNPMGEKVHTKQYLADEYGGIAGEFPLATGCKLGNYQLSVVNKGSGSFRVEEYKKPEFEVKVEVPKEPVALGETIQATIDSRYYFGAPVVNAMVKYKVTRQSQDTRWFPRGRWDWFYGTGYWWFAPEYAWYPGFAEWGCRRPNPWWHHERQGPPEVVLENEVPVGPDGKVQVVIDTALAKEMHGNQDHRYTITAEVVDQSRRTIVGSGNVIVSRKPFEVYTWLDRGHYRVGDTILASFKGQTLDHKPIEGKGELSLLAISYDAKNQPIETVAEKWAVDTNIEGEAKQQIKAAKPGQYRLRYKLTDGRNRTVEGGYVFLVRGDDFDGRSFRFNDIELILDKKEYKPGDKAKILVNTNKADGAVLLFVRPTNNVYLPPKLVRLNGKSFEEEITVVTRDMPNFFVEAVTIADGRVHQETREVVVPPEKRILNVAIEPTQTEYKPGQTAKVKVKLTDIDGQPFVGSTVVSMYDKSVEYISGGTNVPEIKEHFWKWRRHHYPQMETSLGKFHHNIVRSTERGMNNLGVFGATVVEEFASGKAGEGKHQAGDLQNASPMAAYGFTGRSGGTRENERQLGESDALRRDGKAADRNEVGENGPALVEPTIRKNFADTAYWNASLTTDQNGLATFEVKMPDQLTAWKIRVWGMGHGTKVGQGETEVTTKKDLIVRLQAPRFFVQKDEVVLSANVHNYLKTEKDVRVMLELDGGTLASTEDMVRTVKIKAGGEQRVDWRVKVLTEGDAIVRMKALTDEDSDAMEMRFPCYIHGMLKMESFTGVIRPEKDLGKVAFSIPAERRVEQTRLEVRWSPTLAGAMVDALPYLVEYPYGCTEQTLNRFLPTVIVQKLLTDMKLDLKEVEKHQTNLNSQEIGDDKERLKGWKRYKRNPVFDEAEVKAMTKAGIEALATMQIGDGGWGWFSGFGERSYPHTTAVVVRGLLLAKQNGVQLPNGMLERGIAWLTSHQAEEVRKLQNAPTKTFPWKEKAGDLDSLVYMILVEANVQSAEMQDFLYRDRNDLSVYAKGMLGIALHKNQQGEKLAMVMRNIDQFLVQDNENQTAYLRLPEGTHWWAWYGSDTEANAFYLKLLSRTSPRDAKAAGLVKYLLNNRKHSTYWNSTRDTAICIEAMAEYFKASGESQPNMTVEVWLDGTKHKEVKIDASNLFRFDNKLVIEGAKLSAGKHELEIKRKGEGPVYFNAYVTNFTLEDMITKAGLEVKVERKYYKLVRADKKERVPGSKGQVLEERVEKYERIPLDNLAELKSGELVEIELEIESKNDYEYLLFEDMKPAGFEPMDVRSGYVRTGLHAYMEVRDEKVCFFARTLARGKHSVSYRMRAEIPGQFSALPTRAYAMYAPELKGNSDEIKLRIRD